MRDASRCMDTNDHSFRNKSLRAHNKVAHVELLRGLCRDMLWLWSIETNNARNNKDFLSSEKKEQSQKNNDDFRNVVISDWIPDALRDLHVFKYKRPRNKPNDRWLWKNTIAFARANNSDLLRSLKHLMETRLNCGVSMLLLAKVKIVSVGKMLLTW